MAQILGEFGIEGYRSAEAGGNAGSRVAALQAFAGFRGTVRDRAKAGVTGSGDPKAALNDILQAADRCPSLLLHPPSSSQQLRKCPLLNSKVQPVRCLSHNAAPALPWQ